MKKIIVPIICFICILVTLLNVNEISNGLVNILNGYRENKIENYNSYYREKSFSYIEDTKNFKPYGKQDLLNIIYTVINSGTKTFTFYCPKEYKNCIDDMNSFTSPDSKELTHINNFVHPFNSTKGIKAKFSDVGEINLEVEYWYSDEEIKKINEELDKLLPTILKDAKKDEENSDIKAVHDYIINHTSYDLREKDEINTNKSFLAYEALFNHLATCNGYTDLMAIFLSRMGYENFKVSTTGEIENQSGHVWNAVKVGNTWKHLDLTWDDPVSSDGKNHLYHKYFLVTTEQLKLVDEEIKSSEHKFNQAIYTELKNI